MTTVNRLPDERAKLLVKLLTSAKHRRWSLNRIRLACGEPLISWATVRRYAARHDPFAEERVEAIGDRQSPLHQPTSGAKFYSRLMVGTFAEIVKFLACNPSPEARRILKRLRKEDERAYLEAIGEQNQEN
jgi:hypothetical protein